MKSLKFLTLLFILKFSSSQTVTKCPDFKAVEDADFSKLLDGRWYIVRFYSHEKTPDNKKSPCIILNVTPIVKEKEISVEVLMTERRSGEVKNDTSLVVLKSPGVAEVDQDKEFEHAGLKMKMHMHAMYYLLYTDGESQLLAGCSDHMAKSGEYFLTAVVVGRGKTVPQEFLTKSDEITASYGIFQNYTDLLNDGCKE